MIPAASITAWSSVAPWPTEQQIEQDLVLSRLIVMIAADPVLGAVLALRGGTCLHKLVLPEPMRYSEDLDYVAVAPAPVGEMFDRLRLAAEACGLAEGRRSATSESVRSDWAAEPTSGMGRIRVKIEVNVSDASALHGIDRRPYAVDSPWFRGRADVPTFHVDELVATKLRALYQRRKGRDLFDLWLVLHGGMVDDERVAAGFAHYVGGRGVPYRLFADNLAAKLGHPGFRGDLDVLVRAVPGGYDAVAAADLLMERIGCRLSGAPPDEEIAAGAWRS